MFSLFVVFVFPSVPLDREREEKVEWLMVEKRDEKNRANNTLAENGRSYLSLSREREISPQPRTQFFLFCIDSTLRIRHARD